MISLSVRRVVAAVGITVTAVTIPVVTAGVANASPSRCEISLQNDGYVVGPKVKATCSKAATSRSSAWAEVQRASCLANLVSIGVKNADANPACYSY